MRIAMSLVALVVLTSSAGAEEPRPPRCIHRPQVELAADSEGHVDWRARIASGKRFTVVLTFEDDDDFVGDGDAFGTLRGGTKYTLAYSDGAFALTGFSESTQGVGTWTYRNAKLANDTVSLWGVVARFDRKTGALTANGQRIGYLK